jgi:hypothetical protein
VDPDAVAAWAVDRRARIGSLALMIGHKDLLALPPVQARSVTPRDPSAESTD